MEKYACPVCKKECGETRARAFCVDKAIANKEKFEDEEIVEFDVKMLYCNRHQHGKVLEEYLKMIEDKGLVIIRTIAIYNFTLVPREYPYIR